MRQAVAALLLGLMVGACGDGATPEDGSVRSPAPVVDEATATPLPTLVNTGGGTTPGPDVVAALAADLAARLGVAPGATTLVGVEPRVWPDGCLGIARPGTACTAALVPGWLATLRGPDGREYRYRGAANRFELEP